MSGSILISFSTIKDEEVVLPKFAITEEFEIADSFIKCIFRLSLLVVSFLSAIDIIWISVFFLRRSSADKFFM